MPSDAAGVATFVVILRSSFDLEGQLILQLAQPQSLQTQVTGDAWYNVEHYRERKTIFLCLLQLFDRRGGLHSFRRAQD